MNTKETIQMYFEALKQGQDWKSFLAEDLFFINNGERETHGRDAYIAATKNFFSSIQSVELKKLLIDGEQACALTKYELKSPKGTVFTSNVAEIYSVQNGKITSFFIYFDTAPFTAQKN